MGVLLAYRHTYVRIPRVCLVLVKVRGGHQIAWDWSRGWLRAASWMLRTEPQSLARAASALKRTAISPAAPSLGSEAYFLLTTLMLTIPSPASFSFSFPWLPH